MTNSKQEKTKKKKFIGPVRELNPGPLAPEARIIPLDQPAALVKRNNFYDFTQILGKVLNDLGLF